MAWMATWMNSHSKMEALPEGNPFRTADTLIEGTLLEMERTAVQNIPVK